MLFLTWPVIQVLNKHILLTCLISPLFKMSIISFPTAQIHTHPDSTFCVQLHTKEKQKKPGGWWFTAHQFGHMRSLPLLRPFSQARSPFAHSPLPRLFLSSGRLYGILYIFIVLEWLHKEANKKWKSCWIWMQSTHPVAHPVAWGTVAYILQKYSFIPSMSQVNTSTSLEGASCRRERHDMKKSQ